MDYEELTLLTIFTNLHHKLFLLISTFSLLLSRCFPTLDPSCFPFFVRLLLLFFQKNQILNPDTFKPKLHSELLRKKRSFEEFSHSRGLQPSKTFSDEKVLPKCEDSNSSIPKTSQKPKNESSVNFLFSFKKFKNSNCFNQQSQNIFCFIRKFMRNSSLEILNIYEVSYQFVEKLAEINLHGIFIPFNFQKGSTKVLCTVSLPGTLLRLKRTTLWFDLQTS